MSRTACPSCGLQVAYGDLVACSHAYARRILCRRCLSRCGLCGTVEEAKAWAAQEAAATPSGGGP